MRPIQRGASPGPFREHGDAKVPLELRIGRMCSYCERHRSDALHVEHKKPKERYPGSKLKWDNFLLSCSNCNSGKSFSRIIINHYLWPDSDNTFRCFMYHDDGSVRINRNLPKWIRKKARRTYFLIGLDKHPGAWREPTDKDNRWTDRRGAFTSISALRDMLAENDTVNQRDRLELQIEKHFSIWMEVFRDDFDMKGRIIRKMLGTDPNSFSTNGRFDAAARPGGKC
jgi:uncharacterized protein (TIGR02646 family)